MSEAIFERYKDVLRAGHLAALRGRLDEAAAAYREAIELAPDRAVPRAALGGVLLRTGDPGAALAAYDDALARSPTDDAAIVGRAQALLALGRAPDAAAAYDRLADVRRGGERVGDALEAVRRALEIMPTRTRRKRHQQLARELRLSSGDREAERVLGRALRLLDHVRPAPPGARRTPRGPGVGPGGEAAPPEQVGLVEQAAIPEAAIPEAATAPSATSDGETLVREARAAEDRGDIAGAVSAALAAARAHRAAGQPHAALDVCLAAISLAPGDVELHLLLAEIQAERGWAALAADKYGHLVRLADLAGDAETAERIRAAARAAFPADSRFARGA